MPLPVENLTPESSQADIDAAIRESIAQCIREGKPRDQCVAMAHNLAEKAIGRTMTRNMTTKKAIVVQ